MTRTRSLLVLASLLRLADAFDRSHLQVVRDLKAAVGPTRVRITLFASQEPAREIAASAKKGTLAQEVFGREFVVESLLSAA